MTVEHGHGNPSTPSRYDGHRISEFIYGTISGLVALVGIGDGQTTSWLGAALIIVTGAIAIWLAHAYSFLISMRLAHERRLTWHDLRGILAASWPIVIAGMILAIPLLPVAIDLWSLDFALWIASLTGVIILALIGFMAGTITGESWLHRVILAIVSAAFGLAVVAVEFVLHH